MNEKVFSFVWKIEVVGEVLILLLIAGFKILMGTQRLFSVKYLCGEAKIV